MDELKEFVPAGLMEIGSDKKLPSRLTKRFEPKNWKPLYDMMVYYHVMGKSNIWIANELHKTPQQVCNILRSQQGQIRVKIISGNLNELQTSTIESRLSTVADKFMKRIEDVAKDDELFQKAPFAFVDRGLAIIKGLGKLRGDAISGPDGGSASIHNTQNNTLNVFGAEAIKELKDAIAFSDKARAKHELPSTTDNVVEVKQIKAG